MPVLQRRTPGKSRSREGKTPVITVPQARALMARIRTRKKSGDELVPYAVGLRDRAVIGVLVSAAARAGAVAKLRLKDFVHNGALWTLRFAEKGGKSREIPVRHDDLERYIVKYLDAAGIENNSGDLPLFRSAERRTGRLTDKSISNVDLCRMVKRRLKDAELPAHYSPHSFRVTTVTDLLARGCRWKTCNTWPAALRFAFRRKRRPPQQNSWVNSGSGRAASV